MIKLYTFPPSTLFINTGMASQLVLIKMGGEREGGGPRKLMDVNEVGKVSRVFPTKTIPKHLRRCTSHCITVLHNKLSSISLCTRQSLLMTSTAVPICYPGSHGHLCLKVGHSSSTRHSPTALHVASAKTTKTLPPQKKSIVFFPQNHFSSICL